MSYQNALGPEPFRMDSDETMASSTALSIPNVPRFDSHSHRIQRPNGHNTIVATNRMCSGQFPYMSNIVWKSHTVLNMFYS